MPADLSSGSSTGFSGSLLCDLKACRSLEWGKQLHARAVASGHESNIYVASALINMYAKCGSMVQAHQVFSSVTHPNVVFWNVLILGYADNGQGLTALILFRDMHRSGLAPDSVTFVAALKACTALDGGRVDRPEECRKRGTEIHDLAVENGCDSQLFVQNTLIDMYAKTGSMVEACQVFNSMKYLDAVSWNVLIQGYADNGKGITALGLLRGMKVGGLAPDSLTFVACLKACISLAIEGGAEECRKRGTQIHLLVVDIGCTADVKVQNTLIDMYSKCSSVVSAHQVFSSMRYPDVVSWTVLITGYAESGQGVAALDLFRKMASQGFALDSVTFVAAFKACISLAVKAGRVECRQRGKQVHDLAVGNDLDSDVKVQSVMIEMYCRCGCIVDAHKVFDSIKCPDVVSWTALILGYAENGQSVTALNLFTRMKCAGPAPNSVTFAAALRACGLVGCLEIGRRIHLEINSGDDFGVALVTSLVDFYVKCGSLVEAHRVFDLHAGTRNLVTWTALLEGYSICGDHQSVFKLFEGMQDAGFRPDSIALLSILACCSHAGLVDKGKECFDAIPTKYGIAPTVEHYTCMVDLFGRSNKLEEAMALLQCMSCSPNDVTWMSILGACRKWKNVELGRLAFQSFRIFDGRNAAGYVLMGQIYLTRGMLQEQEMVMECSRMECQRSVHSTVGLGRSRDEAVLLYKWNTRMRVVARWDEY